MISEQRIVDIEIKYTYQEKTITELNSVVCKQQEQIDELMETCKKLTDRLKDFAEQVFAPTDLGRRRDVQHQPGAHGQGSID